MLWTPFLWLQQTNSPAFLPPTCSGSQVRPISRVNDGLTIKLCHVTAPLPAKIGLPQVEAHRRPDDAARIRQLLGKHGTRSWGLKWRLCPTAEPPGSAPSLFTKSAPLEPEYLEERIGTGLTENQSCSSGRFSQGTPR